MLQADARAYFETLGQLDQGLDQALGGDAPAAAAADLLGGGEAPPPTRVVPEAFAGIVAECEEILADLGDEITVETLLGPVDEPSGGFFGLRGDGRRIVIIRRGDAPIQEAKAILLAIGIGT